MSSLLLVGIRAALAAARLLRRPSAEGESLLRWLRYDEPHDYEEDA